MQKRTHKGLAGVLALALFCSALPAFPVAASSVTGDLDDDGTVSGSDVKVLQDVLKGDETLPEDKVTQADLNGDGLLNGLDLAALRQLVLDPLLYVDTEDVIWIHFDSSGITVENDTEGVVEIADLTATVTAAGAYYVDGTVTDGQLMVDTTDTEAVELYLYDLTMTSTTGDPCIFGASADKVKLTLYGDNTLTDTATTQNTENSGVICADCDLTITKNSTGTLSITSSMNYGIYTTEDLSLNGGYMEVNTDEDDSADADAVRAKQTVSIDGANVKVRSSADGIKSTKADVTITGGTVNIKAGNDAIQASTQIQLVDGEVVASGDRGLRLDAGGTVDVQGGSLMASGTDYVVGVDETTSCDITTTQAVIELEYTETQTKDTAVTLVQDNTSIYAESPEKKYAYVLLSDEALSTDATYTLYTDGVQMTHATSTDGTFTTTGDVTIFYEVQALEGGLTLSEALDTDTTATSLVYTASTVTAYNADGNVISDPDNVTLSDTTATVILPCTLSVSGTCADGQLVVDVDKDTYPEGVVTLNLDGLTLSNDSAAPVYVEAIGDEVQLVLESGTMNILSDGTTHTDTYTDSDGDTHDIAATIFSRDDMKIKGSGMLFVYGNTADGIVCTNDLKLWDGTIKVYAVDDGIRGNDSVRIGDPDDTDYSTLKITINTNDYNSSGSGGDGIKTKSTEDDKGYVTINGGTVTINAYADGIQAKQCFTMYDGTLDITTYTGSTYTADADSTSGNSFQPGSNSEEGNANATESSCKGIKSVGRFEDEDADDPTYADQGDLYIYGGEITVDSSDDCLHCGGCMYLLGGTLELATADDALHADNDLVIGYTSDAIDLDSVYINITTCYEGVEAVNITQNAGTVFVYSTDDAYNAAGGNTSDSTANSQGGAFHQGQNTMTDDGEYCLTFNGGYTYALAYGDGLDSNGDMYFNDGYIFICQVGEDNAPLDWGDSGTCNYTGGTVVAAGEDDMFEHPDNAGFSVPSSNGQGVGKSTFSAEADTTLTFTDEDGNVLAIFVVPEAVSAVTAMAGGGETLIGYTGGTLTDATYLDSPDGTDRCGYGGTLTGGTEIEGNTDTGGNSHTTGPNAGGGMKNSR